jgi:hypothetical protein
VESTLAHDLVCVLERVLPCVFLSTAEAYSRTCQAWNASFLCAASACSRDVAVPRQPRKAAAAGLVASSAAAGAALSLLMLLLQVSSCSMSCTLLAFA